MKLRLTLSSDEELFLDNKLRSPDLNLKSEQELAVKELYAGKVGYSKHLLGYYY